MSDLSTLSTAVNRTWLTLQNTVFQRVRCLCQPVNLYSIIIKDIFLIVFTTREKDNNGLHWLTSWQTYLSNWRSEGYAVNRLGWHWLTRLTFVNFRLTNTSKQKESWKISDLTKTEEATESARQHAQNAERKAFGPGTTTLIREHTYLNNSDDVTVKSTAGIILSLHAHLKMGQLSE